MNIDALARDIVEALRAVTVLVIGLALFVVLLVMPIIAVWIVLYIVHTATGVPEQLTVYHVLGTWLLITFISYIAKCINKKSG